jgi:hypothetical protein
MLILFFHHRQWFGAAEELVHALYHTHRSPDRVLSRVVAVLYDKLFGTRDSAGTYRASSSALSRLLFILGQGAICSLLYAEKLSALSKKEKEKKATIEKEKAIHTKSCSNQDENHPNSDSADAMEAEMGMTAAADAEHDQVSSVILFLNVIYVFSRFLQEL